MKMHFLNNKIGIMKANGIILLSAVTLYPILSSSALYLGRGELEYVEIFLSSVIVQAICASLCFYKRTQHLGDHFFTIAASFTVAQCYYMIHVLNGQGFMIITTIIVSIGASEFMGLTTRSIALFRIIFQFICLCSVFQIKDSELVPSFISSMIVIFAFRLISGLLQIKLNEELQAEKEKFKVFFNSMNDGIVIGHIGSGKVVEMNQAAKTLYQPKETQQKISDLLKVHNQKTRDGVEYHANSRGVIFPVEVLRTSFNYQEEVFKLYTIRNIEKTINLEREHSEAIKIAEEQSKRASTETLPSHLSHEVNNGLAIISNKLDLIPLSLDKTPNDIEYIKELTKDAKENVNKITKFIQGPRENSSQRKRDS